MVTSLMPNMKCIGSPPPPPHPHSNSPFQTKVWWAKNYFKMDDEEALLFLSFFFLKRLQRRRLQRKFRRKTWVTRIFKQRERHIRYRYWALADTQGNFFFMCTIRTFDIRDGGGEAVIVNILHCVSITEMRKVLKTLFLPVAI